MINQVSCQSVFRRVVRPYGVYAYVLHVPVGKHILNRPSPDIIFGEEIRDERQAGTGAGKLIQCVGIVDADA